MLWEKDVRFSRWGFNEVFSSASLRLCGMGVFHVCGVCRDLIHSRRCETSDQPRARLVGQPSLCHRKPFPPAPPPESTSRTSRTHPHPSHPRPLPSPQPTRFDVVLRLVLFTSSLMQSAAFVLRENFLKH